MTTVSCMKESIDQSRPEEGEIREVLFDANECLTKTAISRNGDILSINWENTDNSFVHIFENGKEGTREKITVNKNGGATISVNFSGLGLALIKGFTYNGIIAGNYSDGILSVPAVQNPALNSFDPSADILIAKAYYAGKARPILSGLKLNFVRANAISCLEVKGMKAGEKIEYVEIVADKPIAGPFNKLEDTDFNGYAVDGSNSIRLEFSNNEKVGEDGSFVTYFSSWTTELESLSIKVITENMTYTQSVTGPFTLNKDDIKTIQADMVGEDLQLRRYELVTSEPEDWSGTYIFLNSDKEGEAKILDANASGLGFCADVQVKKSGEMLYVNASEEIDNLSWDISDSGSKSSGTTLWNVMTGSAGILGIGGDAKYLYDKDGLTVAKTNYTGLLNRTYYRHMFAFDNGTQMISFNGKTRTYLEYTDAGFAYSANEGARVFLYRYKDSGRKSQVLAFNEETVYWPLTEGKYEIGKSYPVQPLAKNSSYQPELLSYSSSDPSIASIDAAGNITIHKQGDVTIQAYANNSLEYRAAAATYQIVISVPYYQRITSASEIKGGDRYLIVSKNNILGTNWYHAFSASSEGNFNYDITTLENILIGNPVYDNGDRIRSTVAIDSNQVVIDDGLFSSIAKLMKLNGTYTIKPVATGNYLFCDMNVSEILDSKIPLPTYSIAFDDASMGGNILSWFSKVSTIPHSITFNEDGTVSIRSALSSMSAIGADLFYSPLTKQYSYVNMTILDGFDTLTDFMQYYSQDSEYKWVLDLVKYFSDKISIKELIEYFAGDMYIYRYIG